MVSYRQLNGKSFSNHFEVSVSLIRERDSVLLPKRFLPFSDCSGKHPFKALTGLDGVQMEVKS